MSSNPLRHMRILTLQTLTGGQSWPLALAHDRPYHLLIWVTRGQGRVLLEGRQRGVGAHNAILVPAGNLFALDLGRQSLALVAQIPVQGGDGWPQQPVHLRVRDTASQSELTLLMDAGLRETNQKLPHHDQALQGYAALLAVWLARRGNTDATQTSILPARFCTRVVREYASGDPMATYAAALNITPTHLSRIMKASTGKSAAELISERTLWQARHLLQSTTTPAKDIAAQLGFGSAAYFSRFIKTRTGRAPGDLRARPQFQQI